VNLCMHSNADFEFRQRMQLCSLQRPVLAGRSLLRTNERSVAVIR